MINRPEHNPFLNLSESSILDTAKITAITSRLQEMKENHQQEFTKQIYNILIFQIYNFLNELPSDLNSQDEVKELLLILQNPDELQLQLDYFNWLFVKIINHKEKALSPSNNKELKGLTTSFYSQVGKANYKFAQDINEAYQNNTLTLEHLNLAFTSHLIHSEPSGWELCPDFQGMKSFRAKYLLDNPNLGEDE